MAFRNYRSNDSVVLRTAFFTGDNVHLRRDALLLAEISASGDQLRFSALHGTLKSRDSRDDLPVVISDGVGYISGLESGRPGLLVWTSNPHVSWNPATRILEMRDSNSDAALGTITVRYRVDSSIDVITASTADGDANSVWASKIFRVRGGGLVHEHLYSKAPVKAEFWPYVIDADVAVTPDAVTWTVTFLDGATHRYALPRNHERLVDAAGRDQEHVDCALAIWPPKIIPGWRLYTLVGTLIFERTDVSVTFWLGTVNNPRQRVAEDSEVVAPEVTRRGIIMRDGKLAPRYLQLATEDSVGYFELLSEVCNAGNLPRSIAVDFGTSATTVAANGEVIDLGDDEMAKPKVLVSNGPELEIDSLWLPTVSAPSLGGLGDLRQIPTGLYKPFNTTAAGELPFVGYTFVSGGFELAKAPNVVSKWTADLKWQRAIQSNGRGIQGAPLDDRRKFFTALLTWVSALLRSSAANLELRTTYPLAFSRSEILGYGSMLKEVTTTVTQLTGMPISLAPPYYRSDRGSDARPFVDEATPLLSGAMRAFDVARAKGQPVVFVADLGGETLDVQLICLNPDRNLRAHRIASCESVRIGANTPVEFLERQVLTPYQGEPAEVASILRTIVGKVIRSGGLRDALATPHTRAWKGTDVTWRTSQAASLFLNQIDCYFGILAEYCARFVAGTLRNRPGLRARLHTGPGPGIVDATFLDGSKPILYSIQPYLIGNGWRMLELFFNAISAPVAITNVLGWVQGIFFKRVSELLTPEWCEMPQHNPDRDSLLLDKTLTVLGTLQLPEDEPRLDNQKITSVLAAPNGYDDKNGNAQWSWSTLVGAGGEEIPDAMQNEFLVQPPLPDSAKLMVTTAGAGRYNSQLISPGVPGRADDLFRVRDVQATRSDARDRRQISAARAAWESVFRPNLV